MFEWTYEGVNHSLAGNGGRECLEFISTEQKIVETVIFIIISVLVLWYSYPRLTLPEKLPPGRYEEEQTSRRVILVIVCLTFGMELGFKFATRQVLWLLNPCHLCTMTQIYLLMAPPSKTSMCVFRVNMHFLHGATLAVLLPVINTRKLPLEKVVYFGQHSLLLVVPYYLMKEGGAYTPEPIADMSWDIFTWGLIFIYHWTVLQGIGMLTMVNLNNMLCPAVSDPFYGRWYRMFACGHQTLIIIVHGKICVMVSRMCCRLMNGVQSDKCVTDTHLPNGNTPVEHTPSEHTHVD